MPVSVVNAVQQIAELSCTEDLVQPGCADEVAFLCRREGPDQQGRSECWTSAQKRSTRECHCLLVVPRRLHILKVSSRSR